MPAVREWEDEILCNQM